MLVNSLLHRRQPLPPPPKKRQNGNSPEVGKACCRPCDPAPLRPVLPAGGGGGGQSERGGAGGPDPWVGGGCLPAPRQSRLGPAGRRRGNQGDSCRSSAGKGRSRRAAGAAGCGGMGFAQTRLCMTCGRAPRRAPGGEAPTGSAPWHPQPGGGVETGDTCLFRHRHVRRSCFRRAPWAGPRRVRTWRVGPPEMLRGRGQRGRGSPAPPPWPGVRALEEAWMKKGLELGSV